MIRRAFIVVLAFILVGVVVASGDGSSASVFLPLVRKAIPTPTPTATPTNTPRPTSTPSPTSTTVPSPTPTNTPTATPVPSGVFVLSNYHDFVDPYGVLHIVGEVRNNTSDHLFLVRIAANFFDGTGQLLDTSFTYTDLDDLPAGEKTCFHISMSEPDGWVYYEFDTPGYWTFGSPLPSLTVFNDSGSYNPTSGWYEILGQVRNDHGARVESVEPVGTLYNSSGTVLGCDSTYVNSSHLDPGQTSAFKISFTRRDYVDVSSYRLQVGGYPQ